MSSERITLGKAGERAAMDYLRKKGYHILANNYRTRYGEIDIIASRRGAIIFVEVKTRRSTFLDTPLAAVTRLKQRHIGMAAQEYLASHDGFDRDARFDVIAVSIAGSGAPAVEHVENAFELGFGF